MKVMQRYFLFMLAAMLVGCAQLGLPTAQTFEEKLTAGYATVDSLNKSTTALLEAKKISSDDAQHVLDQTRNARAGLGIARDLHKTDPKGADSKLVAMRAALTAVQTYLASKEK